MSVEDFPADLKEAVFSAIRGVTIGEEDLIISGDALFSVEFRVRANINFEFDDILLAEGGEFTVEPIEVSAFPNKALNLPEPFIDVRATNGEQATVDSYEVREAISEQCSQVIHDIDDLEDYRLDIYDVEVVDYDLEDYELDPESKKALDAWNDRV